VYKKEKEINQKSHLPPPLYAVSSVMLSLWHKIVLKIRAEVNRITNNTAHADTNATTNNTNKLTQIAPNMKESPTLHDLT
jgi:hypothetical protein